MAVTLRLYPVFQALSDGVPISGGRVYTYTAGGAVTKSPTYADSRLTIPNKNPIVLDSRGEARIFSASTHYLVIKDYTDATTLHIQDNVGFDRNPIIPLTDESGADLSSGFLGTYTAGSSTERVTFADPDESVTNPNPIVADAEGIAKVYSGVGQNLKYTLKDYKERLIWTLDDVPIGNRLQYFGDNGGTLHIAGGYSYFVGMAGGTGWFSPDARSDDGYYDYVYSFFYSTGNWFLFGHPFHCFVRFNNITIPQGSTINVCYVTMDDYYGPSDNNVDVNIYFENSDNPIAPTTGVDLLGRTLTSAVAWDNVPLVDGYGGTYTTPDLSSILQTVINRASFASGNSVILQIRDNGSSYYNYKNIRSIDSILDGQSGNYPKLYVEWS